MFYSITVISQAIFFLTPVVYPFHLIEEGAPLAAAVLRWDPIKVAVDEARAVVLLGQAPDAAALTIVTLLSLLVAFGGFVWFQRTRRGFADVL